MKERGRILFQFGILIVICSIGLYLLAFSGGAPREDRELIDRLKAVLSDDNLRVHLDPERMGVVPELPKEISDSDTLLATLSDLRVDETVSHPVPIGSWLGWARSSSDQLRVEIAIHCQGESVRSRLVVMTDEDRIVRPLYLTSTTLRDSLSRRFDLKELSSFCPKD